MPIWKYRVHDTFNTLRFFFARSHRFPEPIHLLGKSNGGYVATCMLKRGGDIGLPDAAELMNRLGSVVLKSPYCALPKRLEATPPVLAFIGSEDVEKDEDRIGRCTGFCKGYATRHLACGDDDADALPDEAREQLNEQCVATHQSGADTERRNNVMGLSGTLPPGEPLRVNLHYPGLHRVHAHPPIYLVDDFLTAAECDALTRLADPLLRQSLTDGGASRVRTSRSCHLRKGSQPCPSLMRKAALLTNKPPSHMETPQVARYEKGEFYEPHFDGAAPRQQRSEYERGQGGQRVATILVYLNDVPAGGRTRFNALGLEVAPRKGCAIVFFPCFADTGTLDPRALHEARPAVDRKYVCQLWVRQCELPPAMQEHEGVGHRLLEALYAPQ